MEAPLDFVFFFFYFLAAGSFKKGLNPDNPGLRATFPVSLVPEVAADQKWRLD
jgi:hypothetical protein